MHLFSVSFFWAFNFLPTEMTNFPISCFNLYTQDPFAFVYLKPEKGTLRAEPPHIGHRSGEKRDFSCLHGALCKAGGVSEAW